MELSLKLCFIPGFQGSCSHSRVSPQVLPGAWGLSEKMLSLSFVFYLFGSGCSELCMFASLHLALLEKGVFLKLNVSVMKFCLVNA